jgi:hypothetical protein
MFRIQQFRSAGRFVQKGSSALHHHYTFPHGSQANFGRPQDTMNILARALSSHSSNEDGDNAGSESDYGPLSGESDKESRARGEVEVSPDGRRVYKYGEKKLKWDIGDKGANDRIQANAVKLTGLRYCI